MRMPLIVPVPQIRAGDRLCFVREGEVAEGAFTVKSIDGLKITFVEPLPSGIAPDDVLLPECLAHDPEFMNSYFTSNAAQS